MTGADISATMTVRLDDDLNQRLDHLSKATRRTKSFLAAEAIREFIDLNECQIGEIEEAVAEADRMLLMSGTSTDPMTTLVPGSGCALANPVSWERESLPA